ncbi:MAG TPA: T9SS type A sorting domain-containing protein [Bacteroidia bacterium]|nr:T9SS type A sorting domain-containing protein [Bacteroidia bacterium]
MKKLLSVASVFFSAFFCGAQSFTVETDSVYFTGSPQSASFASPYIRIYNTSADTLLLRWVRAQENIPPYWRSSVCTEYYCASIPDDSATWSLLPGDSDLIYIHIYPYGYADIGNVVLNLRDLNGTTAYDLTYFAESPLSINEYPAKYPLAVWPTVAVDFLNLEIPEGAQSIQIFGIAGNLVATYSVGNGSMQIPVIEFASGVYAVIVTGKNSVYRSIFVRE